MKHRTETLREAILYGTLCCVIIVIIEYALFVGLAESL
jgi:hypothetical protein